MGTSGAYAPDHHAHRQTQQGTLHLPDLPAETPGQSPELEPHDERQSNSQAHAEAMGRAVEISPRLFSRRPFSCSPSSRSTWCRRSELFVHQLLKPLLACRRAGIIRGWHQQGEPGTISILPGPKPAAHPMAAAVASQAPMAGVPEAILLKAGTIAFR